LITVNETEKKSHENNGQTPENENNDKTVEVTGKSQDQIRVTTTSKSSRPITCETGTPNKSELES
jgi:hypothetical protein